jgi:uncharacterized protein (DUF58 family)
MDLSLPTKLLDWIAAPALPPLEETENQLPSDLLKKVRAIQIKTSHLVNDLMIGEYVSAFKGRGMEFSEVREYQPGDDVRLIDWNVTARMDQPFIKEFKEERELTQMLLVDVSSSGDFGSTGKSKNEIAAEIASILAFSAIRNNDKVGLIVFSDKIEHTIPPKKGKAHIWNIIRTILNFSPEGRKTRLDLPLEYLLHIQKRKSVAFLISDFQAKNYEKTLKLARQKHDIIAISIIDPREQILPDVGLVALKDAESGETLIVDTHDADMANKLESHIIAEQNERKRFFNSIGIDIINIHTDQPLIEPIIRYFKLREKKR